MTKTIKENNIEPETTFLLAQHIPVNTHAVISSKQSISMLSASNCRNWFWYLPRWRAKHYVRFCTTLLFLLISIHSIAQLQNDSLQKARVYKNVIRYNLSSALLFGIDKYVVFGYERVIAPNRSMSLNIGSASLPKVVSVTTDSFETQSDQERSGFNVSIDYRFYLKKENKFQAPHGLYIGPYYSFNTFTRENRWDYKNRTASSFINSHSDLKIHTIGFELGYQFILWKRFALDLVMIGPGLGFYDYEAKFDGNLDAATKEQLLQGLEDLLTQKFPGMNYVFSDETIDANGVMKTSTFGFRYLIQIGYNF